MCIRDRLRYAHLVCRDIRDFVRLAVDADERGDDLARFPVHELSLIHISVYGKENGEENNSQEETAAIPCWQEGDTLALKAARCV